MPWHLIRFFMLLVVGVSAMAIGPSLAFMRPVVIDRYEQLAQNPSEVDPESAHKILQQVDQLVAQHGGFKPLLSAKTTLTAEQQPDVRQQLHQRIQRLQRFGAFAWLPDRLAQAEDRVLTLDNLAPLLLAQSRPFGKGVTLSRDERIEMAQHAVRMMLVLHQQMAASVTDEQALQRWQAQVNAFPTEKLQTLALQFGVQPLQMPLLLYSLDRYQQQVAASPAFDSSKLQQYYEQFPGFYRQAERWGLIAAQGTDAALRALHEKINLGPAEASQALAAAAEQGIRLQEVMLTSAEMPPYLRASLTDLGAGQSILIQPADRAAVLWYCVTRQPPKTATFAQVRSQIQLTLAEKQVQQEILKSLNFSIFDQ